MQRGAPSLNPKGRPRTGESLAEAARDKVSPEQLVEKLLKLADTAQSEQVRLAALLAIGERGYGKVASVIDAKLSQGTTATSSKLAAMSLDERRALLAMHRGERPIPTEAAKPIDADPRLPEPMVTDDNSDRDTDTGTPTPVTPHGDTP